MACHLLNLSPEDRSQKPPPLPNQLSFNGAHTGRMYHIGLARPRARHKDMTKQSNWQKLVTILHYYYPVSGFPRRVFTVVIGQ